MDEYDVVPPTAKPEEVVNDGLPDVDHGTEEMDTSAPKEPEPEPDKEVTLPAGPETKTCWDDSVIPLSDTCPEEPDDTLCPDGVTLFSAGCPEIVEETCESSSSFGLGWIGEFPTCEKSPELIEDEAQIEADRIAAELAAAGPPPSAVPTMEAFNLCMEQGGAFTDCRFPDGDFQPDWRDTGQKDAEGKPIFEEMWHTAGFGLKPASWYAEQGISKPKWSGVKSQASGGDGTYNWDSSGNITSGPCGFQICEDDPDGAIRDPNHYQNVLRSIAGSMGGGGMHHTDTGDVQLIRGYRPPSDMWAKDTLLDSYNTLLGQQKDAKTALELAKQNVIAAQPKPETETETTTETETETETETAPVIETQPLDTGGDIFDDLGIIGGTATQTQSGIRTSTAVAASGVPAYSLSQGIDGLNTKQAPPIEIKQGDMSWLVGGAMNVGGPVTPSSTAGGGGAPGGGDTWLSDVAPTSTVQPKVMGEDMGFQESVRITKENPLTNIIGSGFLSRGRRGQELQNLLSGPSKTTQPELTVHPIQNTAKEARSLFSGF